VWTWLLDWETDVDQNVEKLHAWADAHQGEMLGALQDSLRIPSKKEPPAGPSAPYGEPIRRALDHALDVSRRWGFRVKDVDGHAGHAEYGEGAEMVGVLCHLDVVPEGDRWTTPAFEPTIRDGFLYARGAEDDKGPAFAALLAARAVMESGLPLRRRVRVIFGCDEESGFGCVKHYWGDANEERPIVAFTPDATFPLIYAEKGVADLTVDVRLPGAIGGLRFAALTGGQRSNMVPDHAEARLEGDAPALYEALAVLLRYWDRNVIVEAGTGSITVRAAGRSAHGSTPQVGDNAVARLLRALAELSHNRNAAWLDWLLASADPTGAGLSIAARDDIAGPLTCNLGTAELQNETLRLVYNIRYPVTWTIDDLLVRVRPAIEDAGHVLVRYSDNPPLHAPLDKEPARTLLRVYREETGDLQSEPMTMGGGTYARATPNAVAFGSAFPGGADGPPHEPDERIALETLRMATRIYAHAIYELAR
jgi:succinyl-diaminopimelate desuccinylase